MEPISFILCNYNAADYFRFSYESLRKNLSPEHEIVLLDDGSTDGSVEWLRSVNDLNVVKIENPTNIGISYSYNTAVDQASNPKICVLHTDMYVPPGFDKAMLRGMEQHDFICAFRAEPSVYDPSMDKENRDFGQTIASFDEAGFLEWNQENERTNEGQTFAALFFPWMTTKELYSKIGGVDLLFLKYMIDDDDLYLRVKVSGARIAQIRDAAVYHFGSRSTRFAGDVVSDDIPRDWAAQYYKSQRNFIRKWGMPSTRLWTEEQGLRHPRKYDIGIVAPGASVEQLRELEPFCSTIYVDDPEVRREYLRTERRMTLMNMTDRVRLAGSGKPENDTILTLDMARYDTDVFTLIQTMPDLLHQAPGPGKFKAHSAMEINVQRIRSYEKSLVRNRRCFAYEPTVPEREFLPAR